MSVRATDRRWSANMHEIRRQRVASLWARDMRAQDIIDTLSQEVRASREGGVEPNPYYTVNPTTGKPYSRSAIERDIRELVAQFKNQSATAIAEYYGGMIATTLEVRRTGWVRGDLDSVLDANRELRAIIGKPVKAEVFNFTVDYGSLSDDQIVVMRKGMAAGRSPQEIMTSEDWPA